MLMLLDELIYVHSHIGWGHQNVKVSDQNIVVLIFLTFSFKCSCYILWYSEAVVRKFSVKWTFLNKHFSKFLGKLLCWGPFFHKVNDRLEKRPQHRCFPKNFARHFKVPILYNTCERVLLVLMRIGLVWGAADFSMFCIIVWKSVFEVLRCSFQMILLWWAHEPTY